MTKAYCYGNLGYSQLCKIKLDAMFATGKAFKAKPPMSDSALMSMAKQISGC